MRRTIGHGKVAVVVSLAVSIFVIPNVRATAAPQVVWHSSFDFEARADRATTSAASPDGSTIVVTGTSRPQGGGKADVGTVAFATSDGSVRWADAVGSPARNDASSGVAISPDGGMTAVTGLSHRRDGKRMWRTIAYSTTDGSRIWRSAFRLRRTSMAAPQGVFVGTDTVLVVGNVIRRSPGPNPIPVVVVAYDRSDGSERWTKQIEPRRYPKATPGAILHSAAYDPVRGMLYLGLQVDETLTQNSMGVLAIASSDGARLWRSWFVSPTGEEGAHPTAIAVAGDGSTVYLGGSFNNALRFVLAFATSDGSLAWSSEVTKNRAQSGLDVLSVSPRGSRIFGAGSRALTPGEPADGLLTFSLGAEAGPVRWKKTYGSGNETVQARDLAVSPDGSTVYVTASKEAVFTDPDFYLGPADILTVAYDARSGSLLWSAVRGGSGSDEFPVSVDVASGRVIVCGTTAHRGTFADLTCLAYAG